ncbi:unnamed protein product, partial [Mesorhabditis belari]|uniref:Protein kinase domain-containing protein n=1 Tax=Mesorhabditis belari TaxID=2138241 RepID=A0AAF3EQ08_9BILA
MFTSSPSSSSSRSFRQVVKVIADFDKEVSEILEHRLLHLEIDDLIQLTEERSSDKHVDYWKIHVKKGPEWKLHYFLKEGEWFETVEHLLNFYQNAPLPKEIGQSNILTLPVQVSTWNQEMRPDLGQLWRIKYEHLSIMKKENEGHYGEVFCGQWNQSLVAIKKPKVRSYPLTEKEKSSFAREARHLKSLNHPNIVLFYGISEYNDIPCMVTEFLENGDLRAFMKSRQEMGIYEIWSVLIQIASGMDYLETRPVPIIHRDLAARNVLIGSIVDGNPLVKISDFGLARELLDKNYYRSNECPFQWCPPETLDTGYFSRGSDMWSFGVICSGMKYLHSRGILHGHLSAANCLMGDPDLAPLVQISDYHRSYEPIGSAKDFQLRWCSIETIKTKVKTFQNDIWSFGVVIWEVFSYGATPYKGIQVNALLSSLKGGSRLERPSKCPKDIYERIMMKCFKEKPLTRPDFGNLELMLMESRKNWQHIVDGKGAISMRLFLVLFILLIVCDPGVVAELRVESGHARKATLLA